MSNFNIGDTVRVGKTGKVEYKIDSFPAEGQAFIIGAKSSRTVEISNLTIVRVAETLAKVEDTKPMAITVENGGALAVWEVELLAPEGNGDVLLVMDGTVTRLKSVDSAAFALSRAKGTYKHAGIVRNGRYVAQRAA